MTKKYFSTNEYYFINTKNEQEPYVGYVTIRDNIPYDLNDNELIVGDNYITAINLSDNFFDRTLNNELSLPHTLDVCQFAPNDFLKSNVIEQIIDNLQDNNTYILNNCLLPSTKLPAATKIPVLSPYRDILDDTGHINVNDDGEVKSWLWSNLSSNIIQDVWNKKDWPKTVEGYDWNFDNVIDAVIIPTDKYLDNNSTVNGRLFVVFIAHKTHIQVMNINLCDSSILSDDEPLKTLTGIKLDEEIEKRLFQQISNVNQISDNDTNNLNIISFYNIDPNDDNSISFKQISGLSTDKNNLYVIDKELNMLVKYDISRCISDRGAASNYIVLSDILQGKGNSSTPYFFNMPIAISSFNDTIAILDKNNSIVKVYDNLLSYKFGIRSGAFVRQDSKSVTICPYEVTIDNIVFDAGSFWIISQVGAVISLTIVDKDNKVSITKNIDYVSLINNIWINDLTGSPSSNTPIYNDEVVLKLLFAYNESNYYYIITSRRVIKLQISNVTIPISIYSYYDRSITIDNLVWRNTYQQWEAVQDIGRSLIHWTYDRNAELINYPQNKCFAITGLPDIAGDIIFNIIDNRTYYGNGTIQRVDNYTDNKPIYIDNFTLNLTYDQYDVQNKANIIKYETVGSEVNELYDMNGIPTENGNTMIIKEIEQINNNSFNSIIMFNEPTVYDTILFNSNTIKSINTDLKISDKDDYVNIITFNKILHDLYYNLLEIKKNIYGQFTGSFNVDNIMVLNSIEPKQIIIDENMTDYLIGENEQVSFVLNRCFAKLYNLQVNILQEIQTKYNTASTLSVNTYKII